MTEPLHHDENTMVKVFHALRAAGLDKQRCFDAITEMQNAGILFRERPVIDEEGGGR